LESGGERERGERARKTKTIWILGREKEREYEKWKRKGNKEIIYNMEEKEREEKEREDA
jgi:hypothetical protein